MTWNILYQFNEAYATFAGVSIFSLLENNKLAEEICFYILGEDLTEQSRDKIRRMIERYGRHVIYLETSPMIEKLEQLKIPKYRGSYATNLKLFATEQISGDIDRILYIDSDTIITGDLERLFSMEMEHDPLMMALDSLGSEHKGDIGHAPEEYYFNAGVMLIDLQEWKKQKCTEQIIDHIQKRRSHYIAPDQDILNCVFKGKIGILGAEYNLQPLHYKYDYALYQKYWKQNSYYAEEELKNAVQNPVIIHCFRFLGGFPWDKDSRHPCLDLFDAYLQSSPWKEYEKKAARQNGIPFRIERWLYGWMPDQMFLPVFRIGHGMMISGAEKRSRHGENDGKM